MQDSEEEPKQVEDTITWSASDSIGHERGVLWHVTLFVITMAVVGVSIWLKQWTLGILAVIILVAILVVTKKPVHELTYELSSEGLKIDEAKHGFNEYRAFGVKKDGALWQLVLLPVKRFGLPTAMFINEDQGEKIVDFVGARLPMEKVEMDTADKISRRLKL